MPDNQPVTRQEFTRQMDQLRTLIDTQHAETGKQIDSRVGEIRRKVEERHAANQDRLSKLEELPQRVDDLARQVHGIDAKMDENNAATARTEANTATIVVLLQAGRAVMSIGRGFKWLMIEGAKVLIAGTFIWACIMWLLGRGPFPPINH